MHTRDISVGGRTISLETGRLAKQADGSVLVRSGDTVVLVTACAAAHPRDEEAKNVGHANAFAAARAGARGI